MLRIAIVCALLMIAGSPLASADARDVACNAQPLRPTVACTGTLPPVDAEAELVEWAVECVERFVGSFGQYC